MLGDFSFTIGDAPELRARDVEDAAGSPASITTTTTTSAATSSTSSATGAKLRLAARPAMRIRHAAPVVLRAALAGGAGPDTGSARLALLQQFEVAGVMSGRHLR